MYRKLAVPPIKVWPAIGIFCPPGIVFHVCIYVHPSPAAQSPGFESNGTAAGTGHARRHTEEKKGATPFELR